VRESRRGAFILVVTALLVLGLVGMLLINTLLAQGAFQITALRSAQSALLEQEQRLSQSIAEQAAPARLTARARELGMVPVRTAVFLQLPDGTVLGRPVPALPSYAVVPDGALTGGSGAPS
jgi:Tfp pilus assembly protein PilX